MAITKHDKIRNGFNVEPEQLAHDLALLKLSKSEKLNANSSNVRYYEAYSELLHEFSILVDDKTRYDSNFKES